MIGSGGEPPTGYHAMTVQGENRTNEDLINTMSRLKGGSTKAECRQALAQVVEAMNFEFALGNTIIIKGLLNAKVDIKGTFPYADSSFDPQRNTLHASVSLSREIQKAIQGATVIRVSDAASGIYIEHVRDVFTDTEDSGLTSGMVLKIFGNKIKVAGDHPTVGVYFVDSDGVEIPVPFGAISHNGDKEVDVVTPMLSEGEYTLRIKTQNAGGSSLHPDVKVCDFNVVLTVAAPTP
jgi:hypothetical protein